jgi:DNA-binding transcriptional LysR family regulator
MNLRQIEVFQAVMLHGSVSAAARHLSVSQPSVSKVIQHAEQQLGFALFLRVRGRLQPTREATMLHAEARQLGRNLETLNRLADSLRKDAAGQLRIAGLPSLMLSVVPRAVVALDRRPRRLRLDLRTHHTDEILRGLRAREIDFGLVHGVEPPQHDGLLASTIGQGRLVYVGRDARPQERRKLAALAARGVVLPLKDDPVSERLYALAASAGTSLEGRTTSNVFYVARMLVEAGLGGAVVDSFTAQGLGLPWAPLDPEIGFTVYLMRPDDWAQRGVERELVQALRAACQPKG